MGKSNVKGRRWRGKQKEGRVREGGLKGGWGGGGGARLPSVFKISHDGCHVLEITAG